MATNKKKLSKLVKLIMDRIDALRDTSIENMRKVLLELLDDEELDLEELTEIKQQTLLEALKRLITKSKNMKGNSKHIQEVLLLLLLKEKLDLKKLKEIKKLFLLVEKDSTGEKKRVLAQIVSEFTDTNTQDKILYAKITYLYANGPSLPQLVACKISDKFVGRPLSREDSVWLEFDPKKPYNLQYYKIVSRSTF